MKTKHLLHSEQGGKVNGKTEAHSVAMFMSVDLAGSTAFKSQAQGDEDGPAWLEAFEAFFREVPLIMMGQIAAAFAMEDEVPLSGVWKVIGDEIVFMAHPKSPREAQLLTIAFYRTVINYDRKIFERWPLRIKGCCWAAQIAHRNREIEIPEMLGTHSDKAYVDFLGPDVDTGFRLASCGGRGQVIVSSNLVQLLAGMGDDEGIQFHYIGRKVLKGVYDGRPYPLFLMTMADQMPETWEWEPEANEGLRELRKNQPMSSADILELLGRIQNYLNHMCHSGIETLKF
jgi:class 3 adenylate cyclase